MFNDFKLFFFEGLNHVLDWQAYDHILFIALLALPYAFKNWKRLIWLVTVFTIGHSASIVLSSYNILIPNTYYIELLIPASIILAGIYTLFVGSKSKTKQSGFFIIAAITLFFGVIHGFGFAGYLKSIVPAGESIWLFILYFALGIEVAQLVIVFVVLLLGFIFQSVFRYSTREWVSIVAALIIGMTIPMLLERL
ncbi:MAG: HupE/UreJ family protein [Flavobacteriaceae bacterium]|nr:HupE/UreJ family protein [Flavobacteriaceae bacterium]